MGLCNSPDIFQEKMGNLYQDLEYVRAYIDDLLVVTNGTLEDHLEKLTEVLKRLRQAGLKVNAKKSFFAREELEYLGYWITRDGIQPTASKVKAISAIEPPSNKKQLRRFIGMVNYYRDMWGEAIRNPCTTSDPNFQECEVEMGAGTSNSFRDYESGHC